MNPTSISRQYITFINSNLYLNKWRISSNVRVKVLVNFVILYCAQRFRYLYKNFFISPASSWQRILLQGDAPTVAVLVSSAVNALLRSIISNPKPCCKRPDPATASRNYNLRTRLHNFVLRRKDDRNYIPRDLYKSTTKSNIHNPYLTSNTGHSNPRK